MTKHILRHHKPVTRWSLEELNDYAKLDETAESWTSALLKGLVCFLALCGFWYFLIVCAETGL